MKKTIVPATIFVILFLPVHLYSQGIKDKDYVYSSSSLLSEGKWFKTAILKEGIYRIDYSELEQTGVENPSYPRIFCNNSGQLPYDNDTPSPDDLHEISIFISGDDDVLDEGEYLLFYGKATGRWIFDDSIKDYHYLRHNYSDTAFYFITSGSDRGKKIINAVNPASPADYYSDESDVLFIHELDRENLIKSGREWYQQLSAISGTPIDPGFTDLDTDEKINYHIRVAARSSVPALFRLYEGDSVRAGIQVPSVSLFNYTGTYAQIITDTGSFPPSSESISCMMRFYNNGEAGAKGWLDYIELTGRRSSIFRGGQMLFSDSRSISPGRITAFNIRSDINDVIIWDVSNPHNVKAVIYTTAGESISFKAVTDTLKNYIVFTPDDVMTPVINPLPVPNQDLHASEAADMVIITHPLFKEYADRLADIHLVNSGLISQVVTPQQIYNEFSGGIPDIVAIRNFMKMKYLNQKESSRPLKYLLLFGDGSYENKTPPPDNPNFIPTYQSQNSNVIVSSFTSDDFYGLLDPGEGEIEENGDFILSGTEDLGIGRLPVSDTLQAGIVLSKITRYMDPANIGEWKNIICIVADDEDGNTHMSDAEGLSSSIRDSVPAYNVEKIYLDAFRQTTSANGDSYPDVTKAINNRINAGCLIFNYVGHGNENSLAHERVVRTEDINSWINGNRLPLFITATCEFSRFDDIDINIITREMTGKTSAGEMVLFNKDGGGIALMSTTRLVYSAPNYFLNKNIYNYAFDRDEKGNTMRLGDIIRLAKNNSGSGPNKRNFSLLGDPALKLAYPYSGNIVTDSINNIPVTGNADSLKALAVITVAGHIEDTEGNPATTFNGVVSPLVYDKESHITTLANDGGQVMEFDLRNNVLFSGKTMAENGKFRFTFIVPRDIDYTYGNGKISYYASNDEKDMNGSYSDVIVGGFATTTISDNTGPEIRLFMNDTLFRNGSITNDSPILIAVIKDSGGINTTGSGIGHDLTGYLDNNANNSFILNSYFENDFDDYTSGKIVYNLSNLSEGGHSLTIKAWDNFNNSSEESIMFLVNEGENFILQNVFNYPNPFFSNTTFSAAHNKPDSQLEILINIFSFDGRLLKTIEANAPTSGYILPPITWDGNDNRGNRVARGIYPYTITVTSDSGEKAKASGRLIIL